MNKSFLATLNFDLNVENKEIIVRELNYDKLSEGIDSIFEKVEIPVVITEPESIPPESESGNSGSGGSSSGGTSGELPGSSSGEGVENITGGEVAGNPSITGETAKQTVTNLEQSLKTNYITNNEAIEKIIEGTSGSTVTYDQKTNNTTVYMWYEGNDKLILFGTGIEGVEPYIYCISMTTNGNTKSMKAFTTKSLKDRENPSRNNWRTAEKIKDINETIVSPVTGETYYIIAEDSTVVGSAAWNTQWWQMAVAHNATELAWDWEYEFGFSISSTPADLFDASQITYEDIAPEPKSESEPEPDVYEIPNFKGTDGENVFTEEQIEKIKEEIAEETNKAANDYIEEIAKEEIEEAISKAIEEEKTEEQIEKIVEKIKNETRYEQREEITKIKNEIAKEKLKSETITKIRKDFKEKLLSQYVTNNSLVFFISNKNDKMSDAITDASNKINKIESKYKELSEEEFKEYIENLDNGEDKAKEILDSLGLDENSTDDEIRAAAKKAADELVDTLKGGSSNNAAVNQILDNCDGGGNGLRYDIYNKIKSIADNGKDIDCILYSTGIAEVTARYFTTGVMHIAVHVGGTAIFGVGTSIGLSAIQNLSTGMSTIQAGTKSINPIDQAQKLADGISNMYSQGTINSLVVGMMQGSPSPVPLVGNGTQIGIQHSAMKVMIMIAAIAGFTILAAGAIAAMSAKTQKPWNAMLSALGAKDGNDLFAMLVAGGIKASLVTTIAKTIETTAGSSGTGLLIPFGP